METGLRKPLPSSALLPNCLAECIDAASVFILSLPPVIWPIMTHYPI